MQSIALKKSCDTGNQSTIILRKAPRSVSHTKRYVTRPLNTVAQTPGGQERSVSSLPAFTNPEKPI